MLGRGTHQAAILDDLDQIQHALRIADHDRGTERVTDTSRPDLALVLLVLENVDDLRREPKRARFCECEAQRGSWVVRVRPRSAIQGRGQTCIRVSVGDETCGAAGR